MGEGKRESFGGGGKRYMERNDVVAVAAVAVAVIAWKILPPSPRPPSQYVSIFEGVEMFIHRKTD